MENATQKTKSKKNTLIIGGIIIVSISALFIMFFMLITTLSEPTVVPLTLPETTENITNKRFNESDSKSLTILLAENNKIVYYMGDLKSPSISPKETNFGENGIRKELAMQNKKILDDSTKNIKSKKLIVIIKPSKKSKYRNLVDILDEMTISKIDTYAIVNDLTPEETKLLASK
mgnify:CR=1 FL=1